MAKRGAQFNSVEAFIEGLNDVIMDVLQTDIVDYIDPIFSKYIEKEIYGKSLLKPYSWVGGETYERRYALLNQPSWVVPSRSGSGLDAVNRVEITRTAAANYSILGYSTYGNEYGWFLDMLEEGDLGFYMKGFPIPVVPVVQKYLDDDPRLNGIMEKGLMSRL